MGQGTRWAAAVAIGVATLAGASRGATAAADPPAPTCQRGSELLAAGLRHRAAIEFDGALEAGLVCSPDEVAAARDGQRAATAVLTDAAARYRAGDVDRARSELQAAADADPSDPDLRSALEDIADAEARTERIRWLQDHGRTEEAAAAVSALRADHPDAPLDAELLALADDDASPTWYERVWKQLGRIVPLTIPAGLVLAAAALYGRAARARLRADRLVLSPFTETGPTAGEGGAAAAPAASSKGGPTGAGKAAGPTAGGPTASAVEHLLLSEMNQMGQDDDRDVRFANGPDEATELPDAQTVPHQLAFISVLSFFLPRSRNVTVLGTTFDTDGTTYLALRMVRGTAERGTVLTSVVLESSAPDRTRRHQQLAVQGAVWTSFAWARAGGDATFEIGGTRNWESAAFFAVALLDHRNGRRGDAMRGYDRALRKDGANRNAMINLALLTSGEAPQTAITLAERAVRSLGDRTPYDPAVADLATSSFAWQRNWYRAMNQLATAHINLLCAQPLGSHPAPEAQRLRQVAIRLHETLEAARRATACDDPRRPDWVPRPGPAFRTFLDRFRNGAIMWRAAAEIEHGHPKLAGELLATRGVPAGSFEAANLAEIWSRARRAPETLACLREVAVDPDARKRAAANPLFAWLRDSDDPEVAAAWAALFAEPSRAAWRDPRIVAPARR